jgi:hypothetical protein
VLLQQLGLLMAHYWALPFGYTTKQMAKAEAMPTAAAGLLVLPKYVC